DLDASTTFYVALGLLAVEEKGRQNSKATPLMHTVVLKCPDILQQPIILLEQDSASKPCSKDGHANGQPLRHAYDVGIGRICFGVEDVSQEVSRLGKLGYSVIAPPVTDQPGSVNKDGKNNEPRVVIAAFRDPSGNMVELVSLEPSFIIKFIIRVWRLAYSVKFPIFVHVNVNASCYEHTWEAYQQLCCILAKHYGRVVNTLYKALGIQDPGVAKSCSLIKLVNDAIFTIDLIEWESPKAMTTNATVSSDPQPIQIAVSVADVPTMLDELTTSGLWKPLSPPKCIGIPYLRDSAVSATVLDPDGLRVEIVALPNASEGAERFRRAEKNNIHVVLVSGCDSGLGRSLACRIAALGFKVVAACYTASGAAYLK
ncbi:MAG: VOC family protein, partial [Gaiellaceae bacterium]